MLLVLTLAACAPRTWPASPPREAPSHRGLSREAAQRGFNALLATAVSSAVSTFVTLAGMALAGITDGAAYRPVWGTGVMLTLSSVVVATIFAAKTHPR
jgi:hypothetical protein